MHVFLDSIAVRKMELIKVLDNKEHFHSLTELSQKLNVSKTTIKRTLEQLTLDFKELGKQVKFVYDNEKQRRVKLINPHLFLLDDLMSLLLKDEFIFNAFLDIFKNKEHDFKQFYEQEFVSTSSAYRKMNDMKKILKEFNLKLDFAQSFPIIGEESQIRYFYACLFWSVYDGKNWYFDESKDKIQKLLNVLDNSSRFRIHLGEREFFLIWLAVIFQRTKTNHLDLSFSQRIIDEPQAQKLELNEMVQLIISEWDLLENRQEVIEGELTNLIFIKELFSQSVNTDALEQLECGEIAVKVKNVVADIEALLINKLTERQRVFFYKNLLSFHTRNHYFKGDLNDFRRYHLSEQEDHSQREIQEYLEEVLRQNIVDDANKKSFKKNKHLLPYYAAILYETFMLEPELVKIRIAVFSIGDKQTIRTYKQTIEQNWFKSIEFVDDLNQPRDLNISDKFFEYLHKQKVELLIWSGLPTVKEIEQLKASYQKILISKFQSMFIQ